MSMVLTVEIHGYSVEEVRERLQDVDSLIREDFTGHSEKCGENGSLNFHLCRRPKELEG